MDGRIGLSSREACTCVSFKFHGRSNQTSSRILFLTSWQREIDSMELAVEAVTGEGFKNAPRSEENAKFLNLKFIHIISQ